MQRESSAGGAGIPAFYTATGVGTQLLKEKNIRNLMVVTYIMEKGIVGDFAFVKAWKADPFGNLSLPKNGT